MKIDLFKFLNSLSDVELLATIETSKHIYNHRTLINNKDLSIYKLNELNEISVKSFNILKYNDINTLYDLQKIPKIEFKRYRSVGTKMIEEMEKIMDFYNLKWE